MSIEELLNRERMLRVRAEHLRNEAQRCRDEAEQLRRAAWTIQHRRGTELPRDRLAS